MRNETTVKRTSDREWSLCDCSMDRARIVFDAWTELQLEKGRWAPKPYGAVALRARVRPARGRTLPTHRARAREPGGEFRTYIEVSRPSRLVLTQLYERMRNAGEAVVTATFKQSQEGRTGLTLHLTVSQQGSLGRCYRLREVEEAQWRSSFSELQALNAPGLRPRRGENEERQQADTTKSSIPNVLSKAACSRVFEAP